MIAREIRCKFTTFTSIEQIFVVSSLSCGTADAVRLPPHHDNQPHIGWLAAVLGLELGVLLAGEDVLAGDGVDAGFVLEDDGEVGAAEEEVAQGVAFAHAAAYD